MKELFNYQKGISTRWASPENFEAEKGGAAKAGNGRKGHAFFSLPKGDTQVLAHAENTSGMIRRIWITVNDRTPKMLRGLKIEFFWDGCGKPAVSAPFGDFFGCGLGRTAVYYSHLFSNPEGRSFNCFAPMPFKTGMKIQLTNESGKDLSNCFYDVDYTVGDAFDENTMYFHAVFNRQSPTRYQKDFELVPHISGKGRFLGTNVGVNINNTAYLQSWWGEGEVKVYLDGDNEFPTLCSTGVEDYVGTGWSGLGANTYYEPYQGTIIDDRVKGEVAFYRYHIPDPVFFSQDIRVAIQQIGSFDPISKPHLHYHHISLLSTDMQPMDLSKNGPTKKFGLFERQDDWSSCSYLYLDKPESTFSALMSAEERMAGLEDEEINADFAIEY